MKTIGIAGNTLTQAAAVFHDNPVSYIFQNYLDALTNTSAMPLILPIQSPAFAELAVSKIDSLLLIGGQDVSPQLYSQAPQQQLGLTYLPRDQWELALVKAAVAQSKPIFGICRGLQLLNVAFGGSLTQDLSLVPTSLKHMQDPTPNWIPTHNVTISGGFLKPLLGDDMLVNSFHHQVVADVADEFEVIATAEDGVIEGLQSKTHPIYAVQWHPEMMAAHHPSMQGLFNWFAEQ